MRRSFQSIPTANSEVCGGIQKILSVMKALITVVGQRGKGCIIMEKGSILKKWFIILLMSLRCSTGDKKDKIIFISPKCRSAILQRNTEM